MFAGSKQDLDLRCRQTLMTNAHFFNLILIKLTYKLMKRFTLFLASLLCGLCLSAQTFDATKVYTLKNEIQNRGYLAYHADYRNSAGLGLAGVTLNGYQNSHKALDAEGVNIKFSIYKSAKTGKCYIYSLGAGKYIGGTGATASFVDNPVPLTATQGKESSRSTDVCFQRADGKYLCFACGYPSTDGTAVRYEGYEANADQLVIAEVDGETVPAETKNAIETAVTALEDVRNVTINHVYNGSVFETDSKEMTVGTATTGLESNKVSRYGLSYVNYKASSETVGDGTVLTFNYEDNTSVTLPFTASTLENDGSFGSGMHWYKLEIQRDTKEYPRYNPSNERCANATEANSDFSTGHLFAFVGDRANGWKIYNYVAGPNKVLWSASVENNMILSMVDATTATSNHWDLHQNGTTGIVFKKINSNMGYINDVNDQLGYWVNSQAASDGGSSFKFYEIAGDDLTALVAHGVYAEKVYLKKAIATPGCYTNIASINTIFGIDLSSNSYVVAANDARTAHATAVSTYNSDKTEANANAVVSAYDAALTALNNVVVGANSELSKKYYRVKNVKRSTCMTINPSNNNEAWTAVENASDVNQIWQFEYTNNGKFYLKNCNKKGYLADIKGGGSNTTPFGTAGEYAISVANQTEGSFSLVYNGMPAQCEQAGHLNWWYDSSEGNARWYINNVTELPVALNPVGDASYATVYLPFPVQGDGVTKLYTGEIAGNQLNMTAQNGVVPAEKGYVLCNTSAAASTTLTISSETGSISGNNHLQGTLTGITFSDNRSSYLVLGVGNSSQKIGFYTPSANLTAIGQNKAYLDARADGSESAIALNFDDVTTGISLTEINGENAPVYDLSGRRVLRTVKGGLYIQNGKKYIVK